MSQGSVSALPTGMWSYSQQWSWQGWELHQWPHQHPLAPWHCPSPLPTPTALGQGSHIHPAPPWNSTLPWGAPAPGTARALCNAPGPSWLSLILPRLCLILPRLCPDLLLSTESSLLKPPRTRSQRSCLWKTLAKGSAGISSEKGLLGPHKVEKCHRESPREGLEQGGSCCPPALSTQEMGDKAQGIRCLGERSFACTSSPSCSEFWLGYEYLHHQVSLTDGTG